MEGHFSETEFKFIVPQQDELMREETKVPIFIPEPSQDPITQQQENNTE